MGQIVDNPDPDIAWNAARLGSGDASLCNTALMRSTPIAVWSQHLEIYEIEQSVSADVKMTHFKSAMLDIVTSYCIAIQVLIANAGQENRA